MGSVVNCNFLQTNALVPREPAPLAGAHLAPPPAGATNAAAAVSNTQANMSQSYDRIAATLLAINAYPTDDQIWEALSQELGAPPQDRLAVLSAHSKAVLRTLSDLASRD